MLRACKHIVPFNDFSAGLDWLNPPTEISPKSLLDAKNINLTQFKGLEKRGGISKLYDVSSGLIQIDSFFEYKAPDGTDYHLVVDNGNLRRWHPAKPGGAGWTSIRSSDKLTMQEKIRFAVHQGFLYGVNGIDVNFKVYNTTDYEFVDKPTTSPVVATNAGDADGLRGRFRYEYCYKRSANTIALYCNVTDATKATATLATDTLTLVITGGTNAGTTALDLTAAANDTFDELQGVINGTSGWACRSVADDGASSTLKDFDILSALGEDQEYTLLQDTLPEHITNPSECSPKHTAGATHKDDKVYDGNGSTTVFSGSNLSNTTIQKESVTVYYVIGGNYVTGADDGAGAIEGTLISSGTINYTTGAVAITFRTAPDNGSEVTFDYYTSESVNVTVVASADAQVDAIVVYRTLDLLGEDADSTMFFKVVELPNANGAYSDTRTDNELTTICEINNNKPPKAKYIKLHKDRMFYVNCPDEDHGKSLVMFSKSGKGESCPSINYQYFDRDDGEEITGCASLTDYFVVFKRNKISVIDGNFASITTVAMGIGCIAPDAILEFEDKVIFLSEEGWRSFDGASIVSISERIDSLAQVGYYNVTDAANYEAAYYPEKHQMIFLMRCGSLDDIMMVGHFVVPLLSQQGEVSEQATEDFVTWTYHEYDSHVPYCLGNYTDSNGITKVAMGNKFTYGCYVFAMDSTTADDSNNIEAKAWTGIHPLNAPWSISKTIRLANIRYGTTAASTIESTTATAVAGSTTLTSGGTYSGLATTTSYQIIIDAGDPAGPNTFKWSDDGGSTWDEIEVAITGAAQTLNNGITVTFSSTTGGTTNDQWDFDVLAAVNFKVDIMRDTLSTDAETYALNGAAASGSVAYPGDTYTGTYSFNDVNVKLAGATARGFRFKIEQNNQIGFRIFGFDIHARLEGIR